MGHGMGRGLGFFYAADGILGSRDPEWIQGALNILIGMFWCIMFAANIEMSKMMKCQTGYIRSGILK